MRIVGTLALLSSLSLVGCTTYDRPRPAYGGGVHSTDEVISAPARPGSPVYSGTSSPPRAGNSDWALASEVRRAIARQPELTTTASQVQVSAQRGVVTVSGSVPDGQTRVSLIAAIRDTPGVIRIVDETRVTGAVSSWLGTSTHTNAPIFNSSGSSSIAGGATVAGGSAAGGQIFSMQVDSLTDTDRNLAQRILQGLRTDAAVSDLLPKVNINVSEGRVLLQGHVQNEEQKRTIEDVVRRAAGVSDIQSSLEIRH